MAHETGGSGIRDRSAHESDPREHDPYEDHDPASREMPERHGAHEGPRRSYDDERERDMREGYR
jgi:hypothetical protein